MAIGERIHFFRNKRGMTQKYLGQLLGFPERSADVRLAQYETGARTPKAELTNALAAALDVSPLALSVPDIDTYYGLMHTLFALEDRYGFEIHRRDGELIIKFDRSKDEPIFTLLNSLSVWQKEAEKYRNGEITKEEYDHWRYTYPAVEAQRTKNSLDELRRKK